MFSVGWGCVLWFFISLGILGLNNNVNGEFFGIYLLEKLLMRCWWFFILFWVFVILCFVLLINFLVRVFLIFCMVLMWWVVMLNYILLILGVIGLLLVNCVIIFCSWLILCVVGLLFNLFSKVVCLVVVNFWNIEKWCNCVCWSVYSFLYKCLLKWVLVKLMVF